MMKLDLEPLDLEPIDNGKLDLEPLNLEPIKQPQYLTDLLARVKEKVSPFAPEAAKLVSSVPRPTLSISYPRKLALEPILAPGKGVSEVEQAGGNVEQMGRQAIENYVSEPVVPKIGATGRGIVAGAASTALDMLPTKPTQALEQVALGLGVDAAVGKLASILPEYFPKTAEILLKSRSLPELPDTVKGNINYLISEFKQKLGIPQERGLTTVNVKEALKDGRINPADAARVDKSIYDEMLKERVLPEEKPTTIAAKPPTIAPEASKETQTSLTTTKPSETKPVITNAAIRVNGKLYEAQTHDIALAHAQVEGKDISKIDKEADGLFRVSDGRLIDRDEAEQEFGIRHSQDIKKQKVSRGVIPQFQNIKELDDYLKIGEKPEVQKPEMVKSEPVDEILKQKDSPIQKVEEPILASQDKKYQELQIDKANPKNIKEQVVQKLRELSAQYQIKDKYFAQAATKENIEDALKKFSLKAKKENYPTLSNVVSQQLIDALKSTKVGDKKIRVEIPDDGTFLIEPTKYAVEQAIRIFSKASPAVFEPSSGKAEVNVFPKGAPSSRYEVLGEKVPRNLGITQQWPVQAGAVINPAEAAQVIGQKTTDAINKVKADYGTPTGRGVKAGLNAMWEHNKALRDFEYTYKRELLPTFNKLKIPEDRQMIITHALQQPEKYLSQLSSFEKGIYDWLSRERDKISQFASDTGLLDKADQKNNYMFQWWKNPNTGEPYYPMYGRVAKGAPQLKQRKIESYEAGIE